MTIIQNLTYPYAGSLGRAVIVDCYCELDLLADVYYSRIDVNGFCDAYINNWVCNECYAIFIIINISVIFI